MTTRKRPAKKRAGRPAHHGHDHDAPAYPGNDELDIGEHVTLTLEDGIAGLRPQSFDRLTDEERSLGSQLMLLVGQRRSLASEIDDLVLHMRAHGISWGVIGWCVGTTSEAARQRWST